MKSLSLLICASFAMLISNAQLCPGGGLSFSTAVAFNQSWISNCPGTVVTHSNVAACEPTTALDPCAPAPGCASGTTGSDLWYFFYAGASSLSIVVNPNFDAAIQVFTGFPCAGLIPLGCIDAASNNGTETLNLVGLTVGQLYYFRVFGATNSGANRTGTFNFCGTSSTLLQFTLPVNLTSFTASPQKGKVQLQWTTASEINNDHFELERSTNNNVFTTIGNVNATGGQNATTDYRMMDLAPEYGTNYYRLKMVDVNGQFSYSAIVAAKIDIIKPVVIVENPVKDVLIVQARQSETWNIYDMAGQHFRTIVLKPGKNEIPVANLPNGVYFLKSQDRNIEAEKFVISH